MADIVGTDGPETLNGGVENDVIEAKGGNDTLYGGDGDDTLDGGSGSDLIYAGEGDDLAYGGQNTSLGAYYNETIWGEGGDDELHGGPDRFGYDPLGTPARPNLADLFGGTGDDRLYGGFDDLAPGVVVTNYNNQLSGGDGNDQIYGGFHSLVFQGRATNPDYSVLLDGGAGADVLYGGGRPETFNGGAGDDIAYGGAGDTVTYHFASAGVAIDLHNSVQNTVEGSDTLYDIHNVTGSSFDDTLIGDGLGNRLAGNGGRDSLDGAGGDDILMDAWLAYGGADADTLNSTLDGAQLYGGDGSDSLTVRSIVKSLSTQSAWGEEGDDTITALGSGPARGLFSANLYGGAGDDRFVVQAEVLASVYGGDGDDLVDAYTQRSTVVTLGQGQDVYRMMSAQAVVAVATINDFQVGDEGDQLDLRSYLVARGVAPAFDDGTFNPFVGGYLGLFQDGADTVLRWDANGGGDGWADLVRLKEVDKADITTFNLAGYNPDGGSGGTARYGDVSYSSPDSLTGTTHDDTLRGVGGDDVFSGGEGSDHLFGGADDDTLYGGAGADFLYGGTGDDHLVGGPDADQVYGGDGDDLIDSGEPNDADHIDGGAGIDTISYASSTTGVFIEQVFAPFYGPDPLWFAGGSSPITGDHDLVFNIERIVGSSFNDMISGGVALQTYGGDGDDRIQGSGELYGGNDNDTLAGDGVGRDQLYGGAGDDLIVGGGDFSLSFGPSDDDTDQLYGGDGNDRLEGGVGN
ncbi:MAG: hypothetical protein JWM33_3169, partial [Caulobacteraceae bacterium]|nr:hypothetical protein [Caulobacteraceae bacterium]